MRRNVAPQNVAGVEAWTRYFHKEFLLVWDGHAGQAVLISVRAGRFEQSCNHAFEA